MADEIIAARVRELFHYDPATGIFIRRIRLAQRHQAGDRADFLITKGNNTGYYRISFDSKRYMAHRVAWLYVYGEWPKQDIDHINGNPGDNRIENLRDVPNRINRQNMRRPRGPSQSGLLGVFMHKESGKWRARIQVNMKAIHIGLFDTPEEAHEAYLKAKRKYHEGCTI
jgi:hypothetical protein